MRRHFRGVVIALVCITVAGAWRPLAEALTLAPESKLWFDGESTVRDWSCKAPVLQAAVEAQGAGAVAAVLGGEKAVNTVTFTVPTMKLDCDNRTMNGHMRKALNAEKHAAITFTLTGYELSKGETVKGTLDGTLTINGVTKPIVLSAEFVAGPNGTLRVTGRYPLKMTDWDVSPPRLMLGTLKVKEMVTVGFDLLLTNTI